MLAASRLSKLLARREYTTKFDTGVHLAVENSFSAIAQGTVEGSRPKSGKSYKVLYIGQELQSVII